MCDEINKFLSTWAVDRYYGKLTVDRWYGKLSIQQGVNSCSVFPRCFVISITLSVLTTNFHVLVMVKNGMLCIRCNSNCLGTAWRRDSTHTTYVLSLSHHLVLRYILKLMVVCAMKVVCLKLLAFGWSY